MKFRISILYILNTENSMSFIYDEFFLNDHILFDDELVIVVRPWILLSYITFKQVVIFLSTENWQVEQLLLLIRFWYHELHGCFTQWYSSKSELSLNHMMFWTTSTNSISIKIDEDPLKLSIYIYIYIYISYTFRIMNMIHILESCFSSSIQINFFEKKIDFRIFGLDPEQKNDFDIFFHDHVKI